MLTRFRRLALTGAVVVAAALGPAMPPARAESWTASYQFPPGDPRDDAMRTIARTMAGHGVDIKLYAAASLLRPADQWPALTSGSIDMVFMPADYLLDRYPQLAVLSLPGLIRTHAQAERVGASPAMRELKHQMEAAGVVILADSWIPGAYASRRRCVTLPAHAKGMRTRTIGRFMSEFWAAAGAIPVPATTAEALPTLVNNDLIDVASTSAATLLSLRMETKFACLTLPGSGGALWYLYEPIMVSKRKFDALDEPRRQALLTAAAWAEASLSAASSMLERRLAGNFLAAGVEVSTLDTDAMAVWIKLARRTAWKSFREQVPGGGELIDRIQALE